MAPADDAQFVQQLSAADRGLRAFAMALTGRPDLVDDIIQESVAVLWRRRADYDVERPFGAWARGVVRLVCLQTLRQVHRSPVLLDERSLDAVQSAFDAMDGASRQDDVRLEALEACRKALSDRHKDLLHRRYHAGESDAAIAEAIGRTVAAVHKALVRLRRSLKRCVEERLGGGSLS
jgi:RNA polymerase sigma-70 factor (ECF subfamily)